MFSNLFVQFERIGLLLMIAFLITRIPFLKTLLYRQFQSQSYSIYIVVFMLLTIISTHLSIGFSNEQIVNRYLLITADDEMIVLNLSVIVIAIAGLWGGIFVGVMIGLFSGIYYLIIGGQDSIIFTIAAFLIGIIYGLLRKYLFKEQLIRPIYAFLTGFIPAFICLLLIMIFMNNEFSSTFLFSVGIPYILVVGTAISIFTSIIHIAFKEEGNEIVLATNQVFEISEEALPIFKYNTRKERSDAIANLLYERLNISGIVITKEDEIIATKGINPNLYKPGERLKSKKAKEALRTQKLQTVYFKHEPYYHEKFFPYEAALIVPIHEPNDKVGLIKLFYKKEIQISPVCKVIAQGIGQLFSIHLKVHAAEKLKAHILDAELRNLQAQINPHFLFNTLHLISSLFRVNPLKARMITIQLAHFMRFNLEITERSLISLKEEWAHLKAYTDIVDARFSNRIKVNYHIDYHLNFANIFIPPSTIQPIVENSIQHGLKEITSDGEINIRIEGKGERVMISVTDNGIGFNDTAIKQVIYKERPKNNYSGIGLYNVNHRLTNLLDPEAKLHIENIPSGGSKVSFSIPNYKYESDLNEN